MLLLTEKRKNRGQTIQRFLEGLPRTGHSTASLVPPAKVNHVSRPDGSGLIQEGLRIPASRSRGNADGVKRLRHTLTTDSRLPKGAGSWGHRHPCRRVPYGFGDTRVSAAVGGQSLLTAW